MFAEVRVLAHGALFAASLLFERLVTMLAAVDSHHFAGFVLGAGVVAYGYDGDAFWVVYIAIGVWMTYVNGREKLADDTDP